MINWSRRDLATSCVKERISAGDELRERAHKCGTVAPGEEPLCDSALRLTCALIVCSNLSRVFFGWLRWRFGAWSSGPKWSVRSLIKWWRPKWSVFLRYIVKQTETDFLGVVGPVRSVAECIFLQYFWQSTASGAKKNTVLMYSKFFPKNFYTSNFRERLHEAEQRIKARFLRC